MPKIKLYYFSVFCLFFLVFYTNLFGILSYKFEEFQRGSDNLIFGRMILSKQKGYFYEGGLSGFFGEYCKRDLKSIYLNEEQQKIQDFDTYRSQLAFQGIIFSVIDYYSPFSKQTNLNFFYFITVVLSAISLTLFIKWVKEEFNFLTSFFTSILISISFWIILFSKSLWWCLWSFYFPFIILLFFLKNNKTFSNLKLFKILFFWFFIKCIFSGYEYITTTVIMSLIPILYYAILNKWNLKKFLVSGIVGLFAIVSSIILSLSILIYKISNLNVNPTNGFNYILNTYTRRTNDNPKNYSGIVAESMNSSIYDVFKKYFYGEALAINSTNFSLTINFNHIILLLIFISICIIFFNFKNTSTKLKALIITSWISTLATLSWVVIFKSHSYIHTHINFIIWYMPFILIGYVLVNYFISLILAKLKINF